MKTQPADIAARAVFMKRALYAASIADFCDANSEQVLGEIVKDISFTLEHTQRNAWLEEIEILKQLLAHHEGQIYFEYAIPRMGKRIDVVLLIGAAIFVIEFKIGESEFTLAGIDQVWDYALDLKNFHEASHARLIAPILCASRAESVPPRVLKIVHDDRVLSPIRCSVDLIGTVIEKVLTLAGGEAEIDPIEWEQGRYSPTPTIIEAAMALYKVIRSMRFPGATHPLRISRRHRTRLRT